jgi:hypothetical protein
LKRALLVALCTLAISACRAGNSPSPVKGESGGDAEWRLAFVSSDYAWHMSEAQGVLMRNGDQLSGVLVDPKDPDAKVEITITLNGNNATARFKMSPEVDEQFATVSGTYRKWTPAGSKGCVEQINLINDHEYLGLFRDYDCKP